MAGKIKFEDWTPPWGEDDEKLDADKVKKLIFNLQQDKGSLQESNQTLTSERDEALTKVKAFETKDETEVERLKRENDELKKAPKAPAEDLNAARLEIALDKGLTKTQAKRLVGATREELEADADSYIEEHGLGTGEAEGEKGKKPASRKPTSNVKTGLDGDDDSADADEFDPRKLQEKIAYQRH